MKKTFYTAIGRLTYQKNSENHCHPVITISGREYMVDLQEFTLWMSLNWRIARAEEIPFYYGLADVNFPCTRSLTECVKRLLVRGLIVSGSGDTEYDALYDLLSFLYIIPTDGGKALRFASFLKLMLLGQIPLSAIKQLCSRDTRTPDEQKVMHLAGQALLSTAEIIKCAENKIASLPDDESILSGLYNDDYTTSENIPYLVKGSLYSKPIILAVANLYLRQQIIFERI